MMHVVILIFSSWNFSLNIRSSRESPSQYVKQTISRFTSLDGDYWRFATDLCAPKRFMVPRAIFFSWCRIIMLSSPRIHFRNTLNTCFAKASTHIFCCFHGFLLIATRPDVSKRHQNWNINWRLNSAPASNLWKVELLNEALALMILIYLRAITHDSLQRFSPDSGAKCDDSRGISRVRA